jgi:hypothetical protein
MKNEYILSVGAGENQLTLLNEIRKLNYLVISCDLDSNAPGKKLSDIFFNISTHNVNLIIKELLELKIKLIGVVTRSTGEPVVTTSKIAEKFGLCALSSKIAEIITDKSLFIKKMNSLNIPSPKLNIINNDLNFDKIHFPVFVKPSKTNISHSSMKKCDNNFQLQNAYKKALAISENNIVNVEEYLIGYDLVSIDFVFNGEIIHIATIGEISTGEPGFDGIGWYSCQKNESCDKLAKETFKTIKEKLRIKNGFFQSSMKVNIKTSQAKVYEIHSEIGGDFVNDIFIPNITEDYNIFKNNILLSLNIRPENFEKIVKPASMLFQDKINEYTLCYKREMIDKVVSSEKYVLLFFKSYSLLKSYLKNISSQDNISINNIPA